MLFLLLVSGEQSHEFLVLELKGLGTEKEGHAVAHDDVDVLAEVERDFEGLRGREERIVEGA
jgi:hypothetical protein